MAHPPPTPDYTPLFNAAQNSTSYAFGLTQPQFDFFKGLYNKNQKVSDVVTRKALGEMDKNISDTDRYRAQQIGIYDPLKEQYAAAAQDYGSKQRQERDAGAAEADVAAQFETARNKAQQHLESFGVDPSQTRSAAMDLGSRVAQGAAAASAGNQARTATEQQGYQMMQNAIAQGQPLAGQITTGSQVGAGAGNAGINTQLANTASAGQTLGTPVAWQQLGNQGLGVWGNLLANKTSADLENYKAKESSSSGIGSMIGSIAGLATAFLADGGAIPDDQQSVGAIPADASPSQGAITDDVPAQIAGGPPAKLNAGEFVMPKDVVQWLGEKGMQAIILKTRKEMGSPDKAPAQPTQGPPPGARPQYESVGAIPA